MKKLILKYTPKTDKLKHFFWGYLISYVAFAFTGSLLIAILAALILAIYNEYKDWKGAGNVEFLDVIYTVSPSLLILILNFIK